MDLIACDRYRSFSECDQPFFGGPLTFEALTDRTAAV